MKKSDNPNPPQNGTARGLLQYLPIMSIFAAVVAFGIRMDTRQKMIIDAIPSGVRHRIETVEKDTAILQEDMSDVKESLSKIQAQLNQLIKSGNPR